MKHIKTVLDDVMTQLQAQRVSGATLKHSDPAVLLDAGTKVMLVWIRSYRSTLRGALKHEYDAYAYNHIGDFVRIQVNSDQVEGIQIPSSE